LHRKLRRDYAEIRPNHKQSGRLGVKLACKAKRQDCLSRLHRKLRRDYAEIPAESLAFGKAVASDAAGRHKGDACLGSPKNNARRSFSG